MNQNSVLAWHFLPTNRRLLHGDGRKVRKGGTLRVSGQLVLCENGLHGSRDAIDALLYLEGPIVCRVLIGPPIVFGGDKLAGASRKVLWWADADKTLQYFSLWCVERAMKWTGVDSDLAWSVLKLKRSYLDGNISQGTLTLAAKRLWDKLSPSLPGSPVRAIRAQWAAMRLAEKGPVWAGICARLARDACRRKDEKRLQNRKLTTMLNSLKS